MVIYEKKPRIIAALVPKVETSNEAKFIHLRKKYFMYSISNHWVLWSFRKFVFFVVVLIV